MDRKPQLFAGDLKPCPFCGSEASVSEGSSVSGAPWWYIECDECSSTANSVEEWNRRTLAPEEQRGVNDEMASKTFALVREGIRQYLANEISADRAVWALAACILPAQPITEDDLAWAKQQLSREPQYSTLKGNDA